MPFWNRNPEPPAAAPPPPSREVPAAPASPAPADLRCSFCKKSHREVKKLIAAEAAWICDECVALSNDIIAEEEAALRPRAPDAATVHAGIRGAAIGHDALVERLSGVVARHVGRDAGRPPSVMLVGPHGVGKSTLCRALVAACGVPAFHAHAHRVTATGYVGEDVENLLQEVHLAAGDFPERAHRGVLVLEDLHHLTLKAPDDRISRDVGGRDVQPHLVRVLDGRDTRLPFLAGSRRHPQQDGVSFPTGELLFVLTCHLDPVPSDERAIRDALIELGVLEELLDRIDVIWAVERPGPEDLRRILNDVVLPEVRAAVGDSWSLPDADADAAIHEAATGRGAAWALRQAAYRSALSRG